MSLACWLTWVLSGLVVAFLLLLVVLLTADTGELVAQLQRNPQIARVALTDRQIIAALWLTAAIGITWSLAAMALAGLAHRRVEAGRVGLIVSAILAGLFGLVAAPVGWLHAAGAITTTVLLLRRPAREWYAGRDAGDPPPPMSGPGLPARAPQPVPQQPQQPRPGKPPVW